MSTPPAGRRALFVDLDGTVRDTRSGRVHPLEPWDQYLLPGVKERLGAYRERGYAVVGVTNQGGVAHGVLTEADVRAINHHLAERLAPGLFDLILYCPYHPRGRLPRYRRASASRKPGPGMAFEARDRLGLDLAVSIMVGDMETDRAFATAAGIGRFFWASAFFGGFGGMSTFGESDGPSDARETSPPAPSGGPQPPVGDPRPQWGTPAPSGGPQPPVGDPSPQWGTPAPSGGPQL
ncbi:MAG TPA: HAD-IIIA family hydrolase, partial [Ktedonobacterales bacterium]